MLGTASDPVFQEGWGSALGMQLCPAVPLVTLRGSSADKDCSKQCQDTEVPVTLGHWARGQGLLTGGLRRGVDFLKTSRYPGAYETCLQPSWTGCLCPGLESLWRCHPVDGLSFLVMPPATMLSTSWKCSG